MAGKAEPSVIAIYDKIAEKYAQAFPDASQSVRDFFMRLSSGAYVFDLGCGPGNEIAYGREHGFVMGGMDASPEMMRIARARNNGADIQQGAMEDFISPPRYDGILANYLLIHLPKADMPGTLKNIHAALKPGGLFYVAMQCGPQRRFMCRNHLIQRFVSFLMSLHRKK
jgi:trans-aconitate methyltransferase